MTRTQMIKRLKELSQILGRKFDTTGSEDELALRLQEAEAEASALSADDDATGTQNSGDDGNALINGPNAVSDTQNAGANEQSVGTVQASEDPTEQTPKADTDGTQNEGGTQENTGTAPEPETAPVTRVKARMLRTVSMNAWHEHNDAPEDLLIAGTVYRVYPPELAQLVHAGLAEPV